MDNVFIKSGVPYEGATKSGNGGHQEDSINSVNSAWEDPVILGRAVAPDLPSDLLPSWLGEFVDAVSKDTQTPPGMGLMIALSVISTCVQKRFEVSPRGGEYRETLSLWTVTAMPPASRKTAVVNALIKPLMDWEVEQSKELKDDIAETATRITVNRKAIERLTVEAGKANEASDRRMLIEEINKLKSEIPEELLAPRLWTSDVTPERLQNLMVEHGERMALLSDEGGIFEVMAGLYSDGKANLDVFMKSHTGSPVSVDRGNRTAYMERPALAYGLTVQPKVLSEFGSGSKSRFRGIGMLARFLYCIPRSNIGHRDVRQTWEIPESIKRAYRNNIFKLLEIQPLLDGDIEVPRILPLSPEALKVWEAFAQSIETKQGEGREFEFMQDWTGKLPGAALKVAGVCHVAKHRGSTLEIDIETMVKAVDLCELLIPHAQEAFDMMGEDQAIADARAILEWIVSEREPFFKRSNCHKKFHGRFKKVDRLKAALDVLRGWNVISDSRDVKPEKGGRPAIVYDVNPKTLEEPKNGKEAKNGMA